MPVRVDWSKRAEYIRSRHAVEPTWANEALEDDHAVWLQPDPASRSGHSVRVVGYSTSAQQVLTVILVEAGVDPSSQRMATGGEATLGWPATVIDVCTERRIDGEEEPED